MPYARIPDELCASDQYLEALDICPAAGSLVLMGYSYSSREASDGFVPDRWPRRWITDEAVRDAALAALVSVGLWRRDEGGYTMLDYLHAGRNISRDEWTAKQGADRERQAAHRARKNAARKAKNDAAATAAADEEGVSQRDACVTEPVTDGVTIAHVTADVTGVSQPALSRAQARPDAQTQSQTRTQSQKPTSSANASLPDAGARAEAGPAGDDDMLALWLERVKPALEYVPEWSADISRIGDAAVVALMRGNDDAPWPHLAAVAVTQKTLPSADTSHLKTSSVVKALELKLADYRKDHGVPSQEDRERAARARDSGQAFAESQRRKAAQREAWLATPEGIEEARQLQEENERVDEALAAASLDRVMGLGRAGR